MKNAGLFVILFFRRKKFEKSTCFLLAGLVKYLSKDDCFTLCVNFLHNNIQRRMNSMNIANQILNIRKEQKLTQEEFGRLFYVTRQTVSNWENGKSYPDLQILVDISNKFEISLDTLLKGDSKMVKAIDRERILGTLKHEKSIIDFFTGAGTGIVASCLLSPSSTIRTIAIIIGLIMIAIGWYKKEKNDRIVFRYMEEDIEN